MDIGFLLRGLLIGLSVAATIGPMSVLCIQRTLRRGFFYGLISGMGIATADGVYGCIAGFGLTVVAAFLVSQQTWIRIIGGVFLLYLGVKTLLAKPVERTADAISSLLILPTTLPRLASLRQGARKNRVPTDADGAISPDQSGLDAINRVPTDAKGATVMTFAGAYLSTFLLTLTNPLTILSFAAIFAGIGIGAQGGNPLAALLVVCGVFLGSALWWCLLTGAISWLRGKFTPRWFLWINRASGCIILLFGLLTLLSLRR